MANRWGSNGNSDRLCFLGTPKSLQMVTTALKLKNACSLEEKVMTNLDTILKSRDGGPTKVHIIKDMVFPVVMYGCESWTIKKAERWAVVLAKTLESPLDCKEIQLVHPKGDQSWIFIGRTYAEAEAPILWPPDAKRRLLGKDPDAGKDWRWEEQGMTMRRWMASPTQWTWVWVKPRSCWWTGKPDVLQSMESQRVGQDWATELNWTELEVI